MTKQHISEDFLDEVIKLALTNKVFFEAAREHLQVEFIQDDAYKELWSGIISFERQNDSMPSLSDLSMYFRDLRQVSDIVLNLKNVDVLSPERVESVKKQFEDYVKQLRFIQFNNEIVDLFNRGKFEDLFSSLESKVSELVNLDINQTQAESLLGGYKKRQIKRQRLDRTTLIDLGIDPLSTYIDGIETGELMLLLGDSGMGKSQALIHFSIHSAKQGYKVAHFSAEGTLAQNTDRFDAAWTKTVYKEVKEAGIDLKKAQVHAKRMTRHGDSEIFITCFEKFDSANLTAVRSAVANYSAKYPKDFKVVVLDYMELFEPPYQRGAQTEERFRQLRILRYLKNLAVEFKVAVITATQASNVSPELKNDFNFVYTRDKLSEAKNKTNPLDLFITMNQTRIEKKYNLMRLYVDKAREDRSGMIVRIVTDYERARFYDRVQTSKALSLEQDWSGNPIDAKEKRRVFEYERISFPDLFNERDDDYGTSEEGDNPEKSWPNYEE